MFSTHRKFCGNTPNLCASLLAILKITTAIKPTANLWRGSLLPLGREAAPKTGERGRSGRKRQ